MFVAFLGFSGFLRFSRSKINFSQTWLSYAPEDVHCLTGGLFVHKSDVVAEEEEVVVITVLTTLLVNLLKPVDVVAVGAKLVQENEALDGESDPTGRVADISGPEVSLVNQQLEQG